MLSAQGGIGIGAYGGGSGGVIVLDDQFSMSSGKINVNGGVGERNATGDFCQNGGAGSIYHVYNDTLVINNDGTNTTSRTLVRIPSAKPLVDERHELAAKLYVVNAAKVQVINSEHEDLTFDELHVWTYSWL